MNDRREVSHLPSLIECFVLSHSWAKWILHNKCLFAFPFTSVRLVPLSYISHIICRSENESDCWMCARCAFFQFYFLFSCHSNSTRQSERKGKTNKKRKLKKYQPKSSDFPPVRIENEFNFSIVELEKFLICVDVVGVEWNPWTGISEKVKR